MKNFTLFILIITAVSCTKKIDATTQESYDKSLSELRASLDGNESNELNKAIFAIAMNGASLKDFSNPDKAVERRKIFDGMSYDDIMAKYKAIQLEKEAKQAEEERLKKIKEKEQAQLEIAELKEKKIISRKDEEILRLINVTKSRFYFEQDIYFSHKKQPIIELTLTNNSEKAFSRIFFKGSIVSKNRSTPWLEDTFNYIIPGGIEPKETKKLKLAPNMFSDWGNVKAPNDAILVVDVIKAESYNKETVLMAGFFTAKDSIRLESLITTYPEFK